MQKVAQTNTHTGGHNNLETCVTCVAEIAFTIFQGNSTSFTKSAKFQPNKSNVYISQL